VLFWFYTLLLVIYIYMRNFANLCIMVWIHMDAHEYVFFFSKFEYFVYFLVTSFLIRFLAGSGSVSGFLVDRSGSGNFG